MRILVLSGLLLVLGCTGKTNQEDHYHFPPEWERHEAVWTDIATDNAPVPNVEARLKIIAALSRYVKPKLCTTAIP